MKNKRWKRQAKRLMGTCMRQPYGFGCSYCGIRPRCCRILPWNAPVEYSLRELEQKCKGCK